MRDNDYTSNQERRRKKMQVNDSGWGIEEDTPSRRQSASSAGRGSSARPSSGAPKRNQNSAARNERNIRRSDAAASGQRNGAQNAGGYGRGASRQQMDGYSRGMSGQGTNGYSRDMSGQGANGYSRGMSGQNGNGRRQGAGSNNRPAPHDDYQRKPKNQRRKKHTIGKIIALLQAILSLVVLGVMFILDVLPLMYIGLLTGVLVLLWVFAFFSQFTKKTHIPGKVLAVIMCALLGLGSYYLLITQNMLSRITNVSYTIDNMVVVVLNENPAQSLQDAADYTFGIQTGFEKEKVEHAVDEVNKTLSKTITTQDFESTQAQVQALYDGQVGAIIYNEAFKGTIEEAFPQFTVQTRTLESVEIKTKVELSDNNKSDANVTEEPFLMYISGNDGYGTVSLSGRSDVNMLVGVNPKTRQILMVSTPRDYYVPFPDVTNGQKDKLTHAGNYGMDCLMNTLESIYDYDIDYYVRVNFDSLIRMVDALGGVSVMSDYDFTTIDGTHFNVGENYVNGEQALAFVRERYNVPGGDFQRGRDQQLMLSAMINKAMSPAILTSYAGIISSLEDSFATSMPQSSITDLIKMQLSDGGSWNIVSVSAAGTTDSQYCYSYSGGPLSVVIPDQPSVDRAKEMLRQLYDGATLVQPAVDTTNEQ